MNPFDDRAKKSSKLPSFFFFFFFKSWKWVSQTVKHCLYIGSAVVNPITLVNLCEATS